MTTKLEKPLSREIVLGGSPFIVTISPSRLRIAAKGRQKGVEVVWDSLLALSEANVPKSSSAVEQNELPKALANDVAREVRVAREALERLGSALAKSAGLSPALIAEIEADPVH